MKLDRYYITGTNKACLDLKSILTWESAIDFDSGEVVAKFYYSPTDYTIVNYKDGKEAEFDFIRIKNNINRLSGKKEAASEE